MLESASRGCRDLDHVAHLRRENQRGATVIPRNDRKRRNQLCSAWVTWGLVCGLVGCAAHPAKPAIPATDDAAAEAGAHDPDAGKSADQAGAVVDSGSALTNDTLDVGSHSDAIEAKLEDVSGDAAARADGVTTSDADSVDADNPDTMSSDAVDAVIEALDVSAADSSANDAFVSDVGSGDASEADAVDDVAASGIDATDTVGAGTDAANLCVNSEINHVILVAVDGVRSKELPGMVAAGALPTVTRFMTEGAYTFAARCDVTHSITLPNMTAMLTGRPVSAVSNQPATVFHGYTANVDPSKTATLHNAGNPAVSYVASVFDVAHDHGLSTGLYASKSKFVLFDQTWNGQNGAKDVTGADDGKDKIDTFVLLADTATLTTTFIKDTQKTAYGFAFLHLRDVDTVGHAVGWGTPNWKLALQHVDTQLGKLLKHIEQHPTMAGHTAVILVSDHGGSGTGHGDPTHLDTHTIPLMVWGAQVPKGQDLYTIASKRHAPAKGNPSFGAPKQPWRNGDVANLAMQMLKLPKVPGSFIGDAGTQLVPCTK